MTEIFNPKVAEVPARYSIEWSQWVLSHLEEDELFNGRPKTDGLQRLAHLLLGDIVESVSKVIQSPNLENNFHAVVEHTVVIFERERNIQKVYCDVAEVNSGNTQGIYLYFAAPTAATKARGRAFRSALCLSNVLTAEEVKEMQGFENMISEKINNSQINFIDMKCKSLNVNVLKFINAGKTKYKNIQEISYEKAGEIMRHLAKMVREDSSKIPENILGYDPNWRN